MWIESAGHPAIEAAAVGGFGDAGKDVLEVLTEDPAAGRARELRPVRLVEPHGGDGPVEVLQCAPARLGPNELDRAEIVEQPDVVADAPEWQAELTRELVRARRATVEHAEQTVSERVGDRSQERLVELTRVLRGGWGFGVGHFGVRYHR